MNRPDLLRLREILEHEPALATRRFVLVSVALAVGAAGVVLWPIWQGSGGNRAVPQPVPEGDQEIVWLNAATNSVALGTVRGGRPPAATDQPELQLQVVADDNAFPSHTTAVPELAVTVGGSKGRLWFRWYKLTGETRTARMGAGAGTATAAAAGHHRRQQQRPGLDLAQELNGAAAATAGAAPVPDHRRPPRPTRWTLGRRDRRPDGGLPAAQLSLLLHEPARWPRPSRTSSGSRTTCGRTRSRCTWSTGRTIRIRRTCSTASTRCCPERRQAPGAAGGPGK